MTEIILQLTYQVGTLTGRQDFLIVTMGYLSQLSSEQSQRLYEVLHDALASHCQ
jgi:hypothetical protein